MLRETSRIACLMIVSSAVAVASCATPVGTFPSAEDLRVEPKPVPPDEVLTSRVAGEMHDNAVQAHGERGWAKVGNLCRYFERQGMAIPFDCPPPPRRTDPG